jgi:ankyrin repeat protein
MRVVRCSSVFRTVLLTLVMLVGSVWAAQPAEPDAEFLNAAEKGDLHKVVEMLKQGVDLNLQDGDGLTALHRAAAKDRTAIVQVLLASGANVDKPDHFNRTPLIWAAGQGNKSVVQALLEKGAAVDYRDRNDRTALFYACDKGDMGVVQALLEKGAEVNAVEKVAGVTPLIAAAGAGHHEVIELLLARGAKIEAPDQDGDTPLMWAAVRGHAKATAELLEKGAKVTASNKHKVDALLLAVIGGDGDTVKTLIKGGADPGNRYVIEPPVIHALHASAQRTRAESILLSKNTESVKWFSHIAGIRPICRNYQALCDDDLSLTPLHAAALMGRAEAIAALTDSKIKDNVRVDVNAKGPRGLTPLMLAVIAEQSDAVKALLDKDAHISARAYILCGKGVNEEDWGDSAELLDVAPESLVRSLFKDLDGRRSCGAFPTKDTTVCLCKTPLEIARIKSGLSSDAAKLANKEEPTQRNRKNKRTGKKSKGKRAEKDAPSADAAGNETQKHDESEQDVNRRQIVTVLERRTLEKEADQNLGNELIQAAIGGGDETEESWRRLVAALEKGAHVGFKDAEHGGTALHWAAYYGNTYTVRILAEWGAPVDAENNDKRTPLMVGAAMGQLYVVEALLDFCAAVDKKDAKGKTAYDWAKDKGFPDVARLLAAARTRSATGK